MPADSAHFRWMLGCRAPDIDVGVVCNPNIAEIAGASVSLKLSVSAMCPAQ